MPNIAHIVSGKIFAGLEKQVLNTVMGLRRYSDFNISVVLFHERHLAKLLRDAGVTVHIVQLGILDYFKQLKIIENILVSENIELVHSHGYKANITAYHASKNISGIKRIRSEHGLSEPFKGIKLLKYMLYDYYDKLIARKFTHKVIAVSQDVYQYLVKFLPESKVFYLCNSVGLPQQDDYSTSNLRNELGIGNDAKIIGIIGRLVPVKNHRLFIDTICELAKMDDKIIGLIVGDGPLQNDLQAYSDKKNITDRIRFAGFRTDVADILDIIDIVVFTSLHEGLPMVLLEAMSMRVPVVSVGVGGLKEVLADCCPGNLAESHSPAELASKCFDILNNPELKKQVLDAAEKKVTNEFSLKGYTEKLTGIYSEILELK